MVGAKQFSSLLVHRRPCSD